MSTTLAPPTYYIVKPRGQAARVFPTIVRRTIGDLLGLGPEAPRSSSARVEPPEVPRPAGHTAIEVITQVARKVKLVRHSGAPAGEISAVADEASAELVVLAWSQRLGEGRAPVIAETLARSSIPLLLLPVLLSHRRSRRVSAATQ